MFHPVYFAPDASRFRLYLSNLTLLFTLFAFALGCGGADKSLQQSEELIRSEMYPEAINLLERIIAADERNPRARVLLAQAYEELGSYSEAVKHLRSAANLYAAQPEDRAMVRIKLAKIYLKLGDRKTGFNELRSIVRSTSDNAILQEVAGLVSDAYKVAQLTTGEKDNYSPSFSPDGSQIAFSSFRRDNGEIYLMDLNGQVRQRVTFTTDFNEGAPGFLSDPRSLIYSREPKTSREVKVVLQSSGSTPIYAGIYTTHIFSKVTHELLPVGFGVRAPRVSPDGRRVVYESNSAGNLELYMLDLSDITLEEIDQRAIQPKRITLNEVDDGAPTFFPDGQRIAFVSSRPENSAINRLEIHQIYTINIDGSDERHVNPNPYDCYNPVVSPDGGTITFVSSREGDIEIYTMDADGSNERRITNGIGASIQPVFSPDGTKLAFVSDRSDVFQIYLMYLDQPVTRKDLIQRLQSE
ncbi:MAG: tetratricopeptide repeat protein [Candidatus Poribacteria bacterium]|nr:tetratricopeptide repeat protein [Candidatus Poribacteria bacterium]